MPMTVREAERLLLEAGFREVKGKGKGSHRKFTKLSYPRPVNLTSHGKEISKQVEKSVRQAVGK
jgi:predicted RNA binding protein YcfA (HicA-like mRNA interferase family)